MGSRIATRQDVWEIVKFLEHYHRYNSNLQDIPFNRRSTSQIVEYYIVTPEHQVWVFDDDHGHIQGVLAGSLESFFFNPEYRWATDLFFIAERGRAWLLKRFSKWAKRHKASRIIMGVSTGDITAGELYERFEFKNTGGMYIATLEV